MRALPPGLRDDDVVAAAARSWGLSPAAAEYLPEGGGSFHWKLLDRARGPLFVRVDDLDDKPWFGGGRDAVFDGLSGALRTAIALHRDAGLSFVVAPLVSTTGDPARRVGERYALSVYPYLVGVSHPFGPYPDAALRDAVLDLLVVLHGATPVARDLAPAHEPAVPWRRELEAFLEDPRRPWDGGPFSEGAHALLAPEAVALADVVRGFDGLVDATAGARSATVVTHGEPHPGNVMWVGGEAALLDWDTVALAPPERDLWFVTAGNQDGLDRYTSASGRVPDAATMDLYRLRWYLDDLASAVHLFCGRHDANADTEHWWAGLGPRVAALPWWRAKVS